MEDLISHVHLLYNGHDQKPDENVVEDVVSTPSSPPLPPTPAGPVPPISYGSKTTKVVSMPATSPVKADQVARSPTPDDFTPKVPSKPPNSIHPSSRAGGGGSPTKDRSEPPPLPQRRGPASSAPRGEDRPSTPVQERTSSEDTSAPSPSSTQQQFSPTSPSRPSLSSVREVSDTRGPEP